MKASCQCITYGRPTLLEESIESFLRQDYIGEKELVILNDHPEQKLVFEHPEVHIINTPKRFRTVGEKRNACIAMCSGDVIFPWDDDDISLPWRISMSLKHKENRRYFKNKRAWLWQNGIIRPKPVYNTYPSMGCWDRSIFEDVGGYAFIQSGQDIELDKRIDKTGERYVKEIEDKEVYYIYRFGGTGHPHLSSYGYGKGWEQIGKIKTKETGEIRLEPKWKQEYLSLLPNEDASHGSSS